MDRNSLQPTPPTDNSTFAGEVAALDTPTLCAFGSAVGKARRRVDDPALGRVADVLMAALSRRLSAARGGAGALG